jgi:hypothetical protein
MLFVATCADKPDSLTLRMENRPTHLAFLQGLGARVRAAGALLAPDAKTPVGSLLIVEGESVDEISGLLANDPFALAGLFASVDVKPWRQALGVPLS